MYVHIYVHTYIRTYIHRKFNRDFQKWVLNDGINIKQKSSGVAARCLQIMHACALETKMNLFTK